MATAQNIGTLAAGMIFYALGSTGLTFAKNLILADLVPAYWRCTANNLLLAPFIINFGVAPLISAALVPNQWQWGIGMFTLLVPVTTGPVAYYIYRITRRAEIKIGAARARRGLRQVGTLVNQLDLPGQFLLIVGFDLLLLPLTIADQAPQGYASGYIIAMFVIGAVALVAFPFVEKWATVPALNFQRLRRLGGGWDVFVSTAISMVDALSIMIAFTPSYNWARILFDYSVRNATYYLYAQSLAVVIFGIVGGAIATYTRRYKWLTVSGGVTRLLALGLMYRYRGPEATTAQAVIPQTLQGIGAAVMTANLQVAAQIAVSHADVAMVTGLFLMCGGIANGAGSAIVGAVQQNLLPELQQSLAGVANATVIATIYAQGPLALDPDYPLGSPVRDGTAQAWAKNRDGTLIAAMAVAAINLILLRDRELPVTQNAVTTEATGLPVSAREKGQAPV